MFSMVFVQKHEKGIMKIRSMHKTLMVNKMSRLTAPHMEIECLMEEKLIFFFTYIVIVAAKTCNIHYNTKFTLYFVAN